MKPSAWEPFACPAYLPCFPGPSPSRPLREEKQIVLPGPRIPPGKQQGRTVPRRRGSHRTFSRGSCIHSRSFEKSCETSKGRSLLQGKPRSSILFPALERAGFVSFAPPCHGQEPSQLRSPKEPWLALSLSPACKR